MARYALFIKAGGKLREVSKDDKFLVLSLNNDAIARDVAMDYAGRVEVKSPALAASIRTLVKQAQK